MKYCSKCGTPNDPGVKFCAKCGTPAAQDAPGGGTAYTQPAYSQPTYTPPQPSQSAYTPQPSQSAYTPQPYAPRVRKKLSSNEAIDIVKQAGSSPLFLTAVISCSAMLLLSIIAQLITFSNLSDMMYLVPSGFKSIMLLMIFVTLTPAVLNVIGMWRVYTESRAEREFFNTGGLTLIKAIIIISLVLLCLVGVILLIAAIAAGAEGEPGAMILIIFLSAILLVPTFLYYIFTIKSINSVKNTVLSGRPCGLLSMYVVVINFILAFFALIGIFTTSALTSILNEIDLFSYGAFDSIQSMLLFMQGSGRMLSILSGLANITTLVAISIAMIQYNGKMRAYMYKSGMMAPPPVYSQPQYAPPTAPQYAQPQPPVQSEPIAAPAPEAPQVTAEQPDATDEN